MSLYSDSNIINRPLVTGRTRLTALNNVAGLSNLSKFVIKITRACADIAFVYPGIRVAHDLQAWVDFGSGPVQMTFDGGTNTSKTIAVGDVVRTDYKAHTLAVGDTITVWTACQVVDAGDGAAIMSTLATDPFFKAEGVLSNADNTVLLTPSDFTTPTNSWGKGPLAILGTTAGNAEPLILMYGTSIEHGDNDYAYKDSYGYWDTPFNVDRTAAGTPCVLNCAIGGANQNTYRNGFVNAQFAGIREVIFALAPAAHWIMDGLGTNDITVVDPNTIESTVIPRYVEWVTEVIAHTSASLQGVIKQTTMVAKEDNSTTQTQRTNARLHLNPAIRSLTGFTGYTGFIDLWPSVETALDSNEQLDPDDFGGSLVHPLQQGHDKLGTYLGTTYIEAGFFDVADSGGGGEAGAPVNTANPTNTDGDRIYVTFDQPVSWGDGEDIEFDISGGTHAAFWSSPPDPTPKATWTLFVSPPLTIGESRTLAYTGTSIVNGDGTPLANFTGHAIANNRVAIPSGTALARALVRSV